MRAIVSIAVLLVAAPAFAAAQPATQLQAPPSPASVSYQVWGFKWTGAQWARQPKYTLTTTDLKQAADYKAQIDSYAGWTATTNLPAAVNGGMVHGSLVNTAANYAMRINIGGFSFVIPYSALRNAGAGSGDSASSFYDNYSNYGDTSVQDMINTQDMINNQINNDNIQNDLNTQNFNETENEINNEQNTINAQANP